jgi:hypothetical protein
MRITLDIPDEFAGRLRPEPTLMAREALGLEAVREGRGRSPNSHASSGWVGSRWISS